MINRKEYIKISFTGDIMVEHTRLKNFSIDNEYDFKPLFNSCKFLFDESDYVIGNLETPVAGGRLGYSYKDYNFNTPESILKAIKYCGIDMVTTANNHVLDRGIEGIDETIKNIERVELEYTGTSPSGNPKLPLIKEFNNTRIAFLSYTYGTEACYNLNYLSKSNQYRVNLLKNQELQNRIQRFLVRSKSIFAKGFRFIIKRIIPNYFKRPVEDFPQDDKKQKEHLVKDIQYCIANNADYIIMCLHSGGQFNDKPTDYTKRISDFCFDNGVDLVVCNHEHVIQKASLSNKSRKICYCLGNFSCDYEIERKSFDKFEECSIVLHLYIKKAENGKIEQNFSFSVMLNKKLDNGQIFTTPLCDEYNLSSGKNKDKLIRLNNGAISRFLDKNINCLPQKEYFMTEFRE